MSTNGPEQLEQVIREVMPDKADSVLEKYRKVSGALQDAIAGDLIGDATAEHYRDAKDFIDNLEQSILAVDDVNRRSTLVKEFANELQYLESSLGLDGDTVSVKGIEIPKESQPGFAQLLETAETEELLDELSNKEKNELLKTFIDGLNITEKQRLNILQVQMIGIMLESIKSNIEEDKTIGEKLRSEGKRPEQITEMIASLDGVTMQIVGRPNAVLNQLISPEIKQLLTYEGVEYHKSHTHTRLVEYGRILEARSMDELQEQYVALLSFLRDNRDYLRAQDLIEKQLLAEHFQEKQKEIPEAQLLLIRAKSRQKIEGMVGKHKLREAWGQAGFGEEKQNLLMDGFTDMDVEKEKNKWIVKYLGEKPFEFKDSVEAEIFDQYSHIVGINGHIADEDWDFVIDQVLINAPLILAGGVAGMAVRALISGVVGRVIATEVLTRVGLAVSQATGRVVATGRLGRALYLGGRGVGLGLEAAAFETAFLGLQGVNIADLGLSEALKKISWTAATLGVFKLVGEQAVQISNFLTKNLTKFPDASVRNTIQKLIVTGNFEVAAVFGLGALQYYIEQGSFEDFEFVDQFLHALVAVGALKAAGGVLQFGGKKFLPPSKAGKTGAVPREAGESKRPATLFERCLDLAEKSPKKLVEMIDKARDLPLTTKQFGELLIKALGQNIAKLDPMFLLRNLLKLKDIATFAIKENVRSLKERLKSILPDELFMNFDQFLSKISAREAGLLCFLFSPGCVSALGWKFNVVPLLLIAVEGIAFHEGHSITAAGLRFFPAKGLRKIGKAYRAAMETSLKDTRTRLGGIAGLNQSILNVNYTVKSYLLKVKELESKLLPTERQVMTDFRTDVENAVNELNNYVRGARPTRRGVTDRIADVERTINNGAVGARELMGFFGKWGTDYRTYAAVADAILAWYLLSNWVLYKTDEKSEEDEKKADVIEDIDKDKLDEALDDLQQQGGSPSEDAGEQPQAPTRQPDAQKLDEQQKPGGAQGRTLKHPLFGN